MPSTPPASPPRCAVPGWVVHPRMAALVLGLFVTGLMASLWNKSAAIDEPGHAAAGYAYWTLNDYRMDPENGNLAQRWVALPYLFAGYAFPPPDSAAWATSQSMLLGDAWFNRQGHDARAMLRLGHVAGGLLAVALGFAVWAWSRQLFGAAGAMISLLLYVLSPTVLAHGALLTSDLAAALGFTLATWGVAACLQEVTPGRVVASSIALAGLFLAKMSAVLMIPIALAVALVRVADGRALPVVWAGRRSAVSARSKAATLAVVAIMHAAVVLALIWAAYGFRFSAFAPDIPGLARFHKPWELVLEKPSPAALLGGLALTPAQAERTAGVFRDAALSDQGWDHDTAKVLERIAHDVLTPSQASAFAQAQQRPPPRWIMRVVDLARQLHLLPEAYLYGFAQVARMSARTPAFLHGEIRSEGWGWFFPYALAVKTPLASLGLLGLAAVLGWRSRGPALGSLVALVLIYGGVAVASGINLGLRHLLSIYPAVFILGGVLGRAFSDTANAAARRSRFVVGVLLAILAFEVGLRFPHYLAYFNGLIRPDRAYRHLVDSSLDWGQELPAVSRYLAQHRDSRAYFAYLGLSRPAAYGIQARLIGGHLGLDWKGDLPIQLLQNASRDELRTFFERNPDFDPAILLQQSTPTGSLTLVLKRAEALDLQPGLYLISATMLQPLYQRVNAPHWTAENESTYRTLQAAVRPLLDSDPAVRRRAIGEANVGTWIERFDLYSDFRFARLTAFLRTRPPDDVINHAVLVFRLGAEDLRLALEGTW